MFQRWCFLLLLSLGLVGAQETILLSPHGNQTIEYLRVHRGHLQTFSNQTIDVYGMLSDECDKFLEHQPFTPDASCLDQTECDFWVEYPMIGSNDVCFVLVNHHDSTAQVELDMSIYYSFFELFFGTFLVFFLLFLACVVAVYCCRGCDRMAGQLKRNRDRSKAMESYANLKDDLEKQMDAQL